MTTSTTTATALARALMEAMATGTPEDFARLVATDAHNREAAAEPPAARVPGPEGWYATALWLRGMFSDLSFEIHHAVADGTLVALHGTMRGVHTGRYTKYASDGTVVVDRPATGRAIATSRTGSAWPPDSSPSTGPTATTSAPPPSSAS